jgi:hypothetical protein
MRSFISGQNAQRVLGPHWLWTSVAGAHRGAASPSQSRIAIATRILVMR